MDKLEYRQKCNPKEHPIISELVLLRAKLNAEFGHKFTEYDYELAMIEMKLTDIIGEKSESS